MRRRPGLKATTRPDATRAMLLEDLAAQVTYTACSLRQMIRAGQPFAMVPAELVDRHLLDAALDELIDVDGPADGRFGNLCAKILDEGPLGVRWVCLVAQCEARALPTAWHGWPSPGAREQAATALLEQTDPIARIERRVAFALDPSTHPLLDPADMPTA